MYRFNRVAIVLLSAVAALIMASMAFATAATQTTAEPYVRDLTGYYVITPLLTVGDEVPMLSGSFASFSASPTQTYAMSGIPDGLGVYETDDANFVFMNHEFRSTVTTLLRAGGTDKIRGARVSLFQFDKDWQPVGGKNLIDEVVLYGTRYSLNLSSGLYENGDQSVILARFCSGYLAPSGFFDETGTPSPAWFAPEENGSSGRGFIVTTDGVARFIKGLGRYSKEQILAAARYLPADTTGDQTVLISTEDTSNGEIYMFVGDQSQSDPNGLENGELYVLRVEDQFGNVFAGETMTEGQTFTGVWTHISDKSVIDNGSALSDWVDANQRSTNFLRPEDIHEDPDRPGHFYFATTGGGSSSGPNYYGKLYHFVLQYPDPTAPMPFELVLTGGYSTGVSYDNLTVDRSGRVVVQEDRAAGGAAVMADQQRYGQIWAYDISSDQAEPWFEIRQAAIDPDSATNYGAWESSGIVEVDYNRQANLSSYLLDVQAHTISDPDFHEDGQLLLAVPSDSLPTAVTLKQQSITAAFPALIFGLMTVLCASALALRFRSIRRPGDGS